MMAGERKSAVVTGGRRGIGFGIACALAREGCDIAICGPSEDYKAAQSLETLRELGSEAIYCRSDVSERKDRTRIMDSVREHFGKLNILVNNAGVAPKVRADILEASEESFDRVMSVNLKGPYFLTQMAANWMVKQKQRDPECPCTIINVSSVSATFTSLNRGEYCISKAGIAMATQLWAARLAELDILVYEVRPGLVMTDMTAPAKEKYDTLIRDGGVPQKRWGTPEDVGKAVAMLVRGDLAYSTGQVLTLDGALTVQRL